MNSPAPAWARAQRPPAGEGWLLQWERAHLGHRGRRPAVAKQRLGQEPTLSQEPDTSES